MRMLLRLLGLVALASAKLQESSLFADNEDGKIKVPELIAKYGYPVEIHNITTADGYILTAHRIPYGKKCGPGANKRVVWLQHGLLGDSSNYVVAGTEKGIGYNLADECYDVWLGNYRGNQYSRRHVQFDPDVDKEAFWSYSWDEIGRYDIPAFIDYVLNVTGVDGIYYIGHSMGTTGFFVAMSERPEYNSKIKLMSAFAPVAYTEHMISPIRNIAPFDSEIEWLLSMFGLQEFLPSSKFMEFLGQTVCHQNSTIKELCNNVLFLIAGYDSEQLDPELLPTLLGHMPAGASARCLVHYAQGVNSGEFRKYNHGRAKNIEIYGTPDPPNYNVEAVTAPVAFYWGENDWLGAKADTYRLAARMPNLQRFFRVNHDKYNHFDFLWAIDNLVLLNRHVIDFMKQF